MTYEHATYEKKGRIAIVTVNRPERMNALHPPANFELDAIWNDFERDRSTSGVGRRPAVACSRPSEYVWASWPRGKKAGIRRPE